MRTSPRLPKAIISDTSLNPLILFDFLNLYDSIDSNLSKIILQHTNHSKYFLLMKKVLPLWKSYARI